jgi:hypothetical protein
LHHQTTLTADDLALISRWHRAVNERMIIDANWRYAQELQRAGLDLAQFPSAPVGWEEFHRMLCDYLFGRSDIPAFERDLKLAKVWNISPQSVSAAAQEVLRQINRRWFDRAAGTMMGTRRSM